MPDCSFNFPKSIYNVYDCLYSVIANKKDAIILDFFAGSGTTAHAVLDLNKNDGGHRRFIICEQMDYVNDVTIKRIIKVLLNNSKENDLFQKNNFDFIYCELKKYNEAYMDLIQKAKSSKELEKIWKDIADNSFLNWYVNPEMPEEAVKDFRAIGKQENGLDKQKKLLSELLNKNQLYVNLSEIDDADFKVSKADKKLNRDFYGEGV